MAKPQRPPGFEDGPGVDLDEVDIKLNKKKGGGPKAHLRLENRVDPGPYGSHDDLFTAIDNWMELNEDRADNEFSPITITEFAEYAQEKVGEIRRIMASTKFLRICNAKSKAKAIMQARRMLPLAIEKLKVLEKEEGVSGAKAFLSQFGDFMTQQNWDAVKIEDVEEVTELMGPRIIKQTLELLEKINGKPVNPYIALPRLVGIVVAEDGRAAVGSESVPEAVSGFEVPAPDGPDPAVDPTPEAVSGAEGGVRPGDPDHPDGSLEPVREDGVPDDGSGTQS